MTVLLAKRAVAQLGRRSVTEEAPDFLAPEAELALAWSHPKVRPALSIALQLDRRLARIVSRTSEPVG
jgi:phytoene synthase